MNYSELLGTLEQNIANAIFGKRDVIRMCLAGIFAGGHILLEDVPGVGKTLLAQAAAKSISCSFRRIQFTPDLLPTDIVGSNVFNPAKHEFVFSKGSIFANIVLADEINRTTPRTQSAMLEAMNEQQVSIDGVTYPLPAPFIVFATENPMEFEGTYPLPESQLDRFLLRISVGYPDRQNEINVLKAHQKSRPLDAVQAVMTAEQVVEIQRAVSDVKVSDSIVKYILDIVETTRQSDELAAGVSTRGAISLSRISQSLALLEGRDFVIPDDVKKLAVPVFAHRVIPKTYLGSNQRETAEALIERLTESVAVPA
ncbi:MAG: MoxR family ATPase [Planctomycetaceae bacterium]|nr:MoxR family ATPase [Planctomycetaceae bacterium]